MKIGTPFGEAVEPARGLAGAGGDDRHHQAGIGDQPRRQPLPCRRDRRWGGPPDTGSRPAATTRAEPATIAPELQKEFAVNPSSTMTAYGCRRVTFGRLEMDGQWVTYAEAAARLGVSIEAVRQRAIRNKWARTLGNDKRARVRLPDEPYPSQTPVIRPSDQALTDALKAHVETLKGDIEALRAQLQAAAADLEAERARTSTAISAFSALADRLDALAAERARQWWRRLAG
jgi:hypothetical protein